MGIAKSTCWHFDSSKQYRVTPDGQKRSFPILHSNKIYPISEPKPTLTPRTKKKNVEILSSFVPFSVRKKFTNKNNNKTGFHKFHGALLIVDISGFSKLSERLLSEKHSLGVEQLSKHMNAYFSFIISEIKNYGGDAHSFAGDCIIAIFGSPFGNEEISLTEWAERAVQCALEIQKKHPKYEVDDITLNLHIAVGAGVLNMLFVGVEGGYWSCIVVGRPFSQLKSAIDLATNGQVVVSNEVYELVNSKFTFSGQFSTKDWLVNSNYNSYFSTPNTEFTTVIKPVDHSKLDERAIRCFIPINVQEKIDNLVGSSLSELKKISVFFINLSSIVESEVIDDKEFELIENVYIKIQTFAEKYEGMTKMFHDEKGLHVLATFGAHSFHADDPVRAVKAALEIKKALDYLSISHSIGISTGTCFCGVVGSSDRQDYDVIGKAVNLASRLEMTPNEYGLLCDEITYESCKDAIPFNTKIKPISVKGKKEPIRVYQPLFKRHSMSTTSSDRNRCAENIQLFGRQKETAMLFEAVCVTPFEKQHKIISIVSEIGLGKTALLKNLMKFVKHLESYTVFYESCDPVESSTPFFVWRNIFFNLLLNEEEIFKIDECQETIQEILIKKFKKDYPQFIEYTSLLSTVLPYDIPPNAVTKNLQGKEKGDKTKELLLHILQKHIQDKKLTIIFDDFQYIDVASAELLQKLLECKPKHPILVLIAYKTAQHIPQEALYFVESSTKIHLRPFDRKATRTFICSYLSCSAVHKDLANLAMEKTQGNPFFLIEFINHLKDNKKIVIDKERIAVLKGSVDSISLPNNLRDVLQSKIDQLSSTTQMVLKIASIFGKQFYIEALYELYPSKNKEIIEQCIKELVYKDFLEHAENEQMKFKHLTMQEITYELMLHEQRTQLHKQAAVWYEKKFKDNLSNYFTILAHHWRKVAEGEKGKNEFVKKALSYFIKSGDHANMNAVLSTASKIYGETAELLDLFFPTNEEESEYKRKIELDLCIKRGFLYYVYNLEEFESKVAEEVYSRGKELCKREEHLEFIMCVFPQCINNCLTGKLDKGINYTKILIVLATQDCHEMECRLEGCDDTFAKIQLLHALFTVKLPMGDLQNTKTYCEHLCDIYDHDEHFEFGKTFSHDAHACAKIHLTIVSYNLGDYSACWTLLQELLKMETSHIPTKIHSSVFTNMMLLLLDNIDMVLQNIEEIYANVEDFGNPLYIMMVQFIQGCAICKKEENTEGLEMMIQSLKNLTDRGIYYQYTLFISLIADVLISNEMIEEALKFIQHGISLSNEKGETIFNSLLYMNRGRCYHHVGMNEDDDKKKLEGFLEAKKSFETSVKIATDQKAHGLLVKILVQQYKFVKDFMKYQTLKERTFDIVESEVNELEIVKTLARIFKNIKCDNRFSVPEVEAAKAILQIYYS